MIDFLPRISFINPEYLWLLSIIPFVIWWYISPNKQYYPNLRISNPGIFSILTTRRVQYRKYLPLLRALSWSFLVIALARPRAAIKDENIKGLGIDIIIALDVSSSMLTDDFIPNRLSVSRHVAGKFINKRKADRIGLTVFAGEALTKCPVTTDHESLKGMLYTLKTGDVEDGTAIGLGLASAVNRLKNSNAKSKIVILLTDGVNTMGFPEPIMAAKIAKTLGVKVYTIGMGSTAKANTPLNIKSDGKYIYDLAVVKVDEALLIQIAEITGGKYFRATAEKSLEAVYEEINALEKTPFDITSLKRHSEVFHVFTFFGIVCLLAEVVLRYSLLRVWP